MVLVREQLDLAGRSEESLADLEFGNIPVVAADVVIERHRVGLERDHEGAQSQRPCGPVQRERYAPCVAASVGRVVPTRPVHQRPVEELRARVVAVGVVVEDVGHRDLAGREDQARDCLVTGKLE